MESNETDCKRVFAELNANDIHNALLAYIACKHPEANKCHLRFISIKTDENGDPRSGTVEIYC